MATQLPVILFSTQFKNENQMVNSAECDCACPDNGFSLSITSVFANEFWQQSEVHNQYLAQGYSLMFNPLHDSGVVVLNTVAKQIWDKFQIPRALETLNAIEDDQDSSHAVKELMKAGLLEPVNASVQPYKGLPDTLSVWLHVTNECNLRCDYCYISKTHEAMSQDVGHASIDAIIRSAKQGAFKRIKLKFSGGEATLNLKLVFELHTYAKELTNRAGLELETVILSNGVAVGERAIAEFVKRGIGVMISLDGIGDMHDAQRKFINGKGSFAWTSRTLDRLVVQGIKPFISITVTDRNTDGLAEAVGYVLDRDLPFNINFFRDNDCIVSSDDLQLRDERVIATMFEAFDVIETRLPSYSLLGSLVDRAQFDRPHDKACGVGDSYMVIDHHGNVAKCHMEIETPITSVYVDDPLTHIRADQIGIQNISVEEKEGCRECEWRYWCAGGCPLLTFRATGRYDVKSPYCRIYKAIYPRLLRLEGLRLLKLSGVLEV